MFIFGICDTGKLYPPVAKLRENSAVKIALLFSAGLFFKLHCVDSRIKENEQPRNFLWINQP